MQQPLGLVKVDGLADVWRDALVVLIRLLYTIDLNRKKDWNRELIQPVCERNCLGCAPTVSEDHDPAGLLSVAAPTAVVVAVEEFKHGLQSIAAIAIGEDLGMHVKRVPRLQRPGKLRFHVRKIVGVNVSSHKPDHEQL
jgi:hypothetical protein